MDDSVSGSEKPGLIERLRTGDDAAFGELFEAHEPAVRRLARGLVCDAAEADDVTAETFFRVLQAVRRGNGPRDNVRAYLLTVARRVAWEWQGARRDVPVTDEELTSKAGVGSDWQNRTAEASLITRAFSSLPERWRTVLWQTEVEGEQPAVVAPHFGLSANATAALARRARIGLRAAYLQAHLTTDRGANGCRSIREKLGGYTAGIVTGTEARRIDHHLSVCSPCRSTHDELRQVCSALRTHASALVVLVPVSGMALGAATGGLGGAGATTTGVTVGTTTVGAGGAAVGGLQAGAVVTLAAPSKLALVLASTAAVAGVVGGPVLGDLGDAERASASPGGSHSAYPGGNGDTSGPVRKAPGRLGFGTTTSVGDPARSASPAELSGGPDSSLESPARYTLATRRMQDPPAGTVPAVRSGFPALPDQASRRPGRPPADGETGGVVIGPPRDGPPRDERNNGQGPPARAPGHAGGDGPGRGVGVGDGRGRGGGGDRGGDGAAATGTVMVATGPMDRTTTARPTARLPEGYRSGGPRTGTARPSGRR